MALTCASDDTNLLSTTALTTKYLATDLSIPYCSKVNLPLMLQRLWFIYFLRGCGTVLKKAPLAAARENLPIVAAKLESTAQCRTVPVPSNTGLPKMRESWLIKGAAQCRGKMNEETVGDKKRVHELSQLPPSLTALTDQFREGNATLKSNSS